MIKKSNIESALTEIDDQGFLQTHHHAAALALSELDCFKAFSAYQPETTSQGVLECIYEMQQLSCSIAKLPAASLISLDCSQAVFACLSMVNKYHQRKRQARGTLLIGTEQPEVKVVADRTGFEVRTFSISQLEENLKPEVAAIVLPVNALVEEKIVIDSLLTRIRDLDILIYRDGSGQYALSTQFDTDNLVADLVNIDLAHLCETGPACHAVIAGEKLKPFLPVPLVQQADNQFRLQTQFQNPLSIGSLNTSAGNIEAIIRCYVQFRLKGVNGIQRQAKKAIVSALYTVKKITDAGVGKDCSALLSSGECSVTFTYSSVSIVSLQQQLESFCLMGLKIVRVNRKADDRFALTIGHLHYLTKDQLDSLVELILNFQ